MKILNTYNDNKNKILFSNFKKVSKNRKELISQFNNEYFNKKNNDSIKNVNYQKFLELDYKYNLSKKKPVTKKNSNGAYSIVLVNGQCQDFTDDIIDLSKLDLNNQDFYFDNSLSSNKDFFIDLNSLLLNCGFKLKVKKNKNVKIKISNIVSDENLTIFQKNLIYCDEGCKINITEEYQNKFAAVYNIFNILELKRKSELFHTIIQDNGKSHNLSLSSFASCKFKSHYKQRVYNFSNGYVRNFHFSDLNDIESEVDLKGFFFLKDSNISDNKTFVKHLAENCKSNQIYKGILNDNSKAAYFSNTFVDSIAQKTEGYQLSKGILLSDNSSYFSKPELKIFADDVKCSHGSTIGPIDEKAIFYLRSRGISKNSAIKMLVSSFINEDIDSIKDEDIAETIKEKLTNYLDNIK